jgi:hypothetical protein
VEASAAADSTRRHRKLVMTLIVVGAIVGFLAVFSVWAKRQLLETETWKDTSEELLENQDIREQVAGFMVDTLFTQVDVQAKLETALPPRAQPAAGVIAGAARNVADDLANEALQRPKVQEAWAVANENAHRKLIEVVEKGGEGDVTLDLGEIISQLGGQIGVDVSSKLPEGAGEIVILETDQLQAAQDVVDLLETLAWALTALALLIFALALYLARGWRRVALRDVGFAFIIIGVLVLVVRGIAGGAVVDSLASTASVEPAVQATWDIGTSLLGAGGGAMLFYGIVILLGSWLAAPTGLGHDARRAIAPVLHKRTTAYAALLLILLILFWWSPTPGFDRLPTSILLILLFIVGLEFLRHQAIKDFPDETWEAGSARWQASGRSLFRRGGSDGGAS